MPIRISSLLSRNRKIKMDENLKQEALLRHLLSRRKNSTDDELLYSFLLGFRLFLSPHQLLTEFQALLTEDISRNMQSASAETMCSKCHQLHTRSTTAAASNSKSEDVLTKSTTVESNVIPLVSSNVTSTSTSQTDTRSHTFVSSAFINMTAPVTTVPDNAVVDGEDTIRRQKRGRRRIQIDESLQVKVDAPNTDNMLAVNRSTSLSCDSGILSGVIDLDDLDRKNRSNTITKTSEVKPSNNNSGFAELDSPGNCTHCQGTSGKETNSSFKQQLIHILREWVRRFPADFRNKKIMWTLNDVIKGCQSENEQLNGLCAQVVDCISRRTAAQENYEQRLSSFEHENSLATTQKCYKKDVAVNFVLKLKDASDINKMAQQLCLIEMDFLKHVGAEEFLQLFTSDGDEDARTNLGACVRWFNRLSHLVATVICMCRKRKHGRHVITFFARVANRCFELSNFNSSMAILTGLSLGPVTRLNKTRNKLGLTELHKLQNVFDPSNNFLTYRSIYISCIEKLQSSKAGNEAANRYSIISQHSVGSVASTTSQQGDSGIECDHETPTPGCTKATCCGSKRPLKARFTFDPQNVPQEGTVVPFLVLLVKDVYFLNHAIQTVDESGNINFEKLQNLSNILRPLEDWKHMTPSYQKDVEMQEFLLSTPVKDDEDLYLLSYKREAPTNRFEKQQLKSLKTERDLKRGREAASILRSKTL